MREGYILTSYALTLDDVNDILGLGKLLTVIAECPTSNNNGLHSGLFKSEESQR